MKRGFTVWQLVFLLGILVVLAAISFPYFRRARECCRPGGPSCQSQLKNMGLAFQQYLQDNDQYLPPARERGADLGWVDALEPYVKRAAVFQCPQSGSNGANFTEATPRRTDYFMNSRLSGLTLRRFASTSLTVVNGEGLLEMTPLTPGYALDSIPAAWPADLGSPRNRHLAGSNFGFMDGHVKWFPATVDFNTGSPRKGMTSFLPE